MSKATEKTKKQLKGWGTAYYTTEYGPVTGGLIAAMIINPKFSPKFPSKKHITNPVSPLYTAR